MRVIDLLNKRANGEEMPKEIIGRNSLGKKEKYTYNDFWYIHTFENPDGEEYYYYMNKDIRNLNDEVEIMEEKKEVSFIDYCELKHENEKLNNKLSMIKNNINTLSKEDILSIIDKYTGFWGIPDEFNDNELKGK